MGRVPGIQFAMVVSAARKQADNISFEQKVSQEERAASEVTSRIIGRFIHSTKLREVVPHRTLDELFWVLSVLGW